MIRVSGLKAGYDGKTVITDIDLTVERSEFIGVLGPNACGKSTLVKVLSGLLTPQAGEVSVGGLNPSKAPPAELAKLLAVVPQATSIPFPFTGEEVVTFGRYAHAGRFAPLSEADRKAVAEALTLTDTVELSARPITEVSGGERQRIILARALAQETPLLVLDEATASMDIHRAVDAFELLSALNKAGKTVMAVLHDLNLAALYCERLFFLKAGKVVADGPTSEVFTSAIIKEAYETNVEVYTHQLTGKPHAVFLGKRERVSS